MGGLIALLIPAFIELLKNAKCFGQDPTADPNDPKATLRNHMDPDGTFDRRYIRHNIPVARKTAFDNNLGHLSRREAYSAVVATFKKAMAADDDLVARAMANPHDQAAVAAVAAIEVEAEDDE